MSATDELRRLLEEQGIKHFDYDKGGRTQTQWAAPDGTRHFTYETYNNPSKTAKLVISWFPTPEQAIAATLGRGTCKMEQMPECQFDDIACSECGVALWAFSMDKEGEGVLATPNYCPNCGAKVVSE